MAGVGRLLVGPGALRPRAKTQRASPLAVRPRLAPAQLGALITEKRRAWIRGRASRRFGCERTGSRSNFVAAEPPAAEDQAQRAGNSGISVRMTRAATTCD